MKELIINELCVEVTRKCNMKCSHCMRGYAQNINLDSEKIEYLFNNQELNIIAINRLIITGGEPTLNCQIIIDIINKIINKSIIVKSFIMVINGSNYNTKLIDALNMLYQYKQNNDNENLFDVICSLDQFHKKPKKEVLEEYKKLPYFKGVNKILETNDIMCIGRAYLNNLGDIDTYFLSKATHLYYLYNNYPTTYEENEKLYLNKLYLSSKGLYGFFIMDATYDMIDELCIYKQEELNSLINKEIKIKRKQKM